HTPSTQNHTLSLHDALPISISVARKVMEQTPHVMLAGKGAEKFAYQQGFSKENLLTEKSKKEWLQWKKESKYETIINIENHDTIDRKSTRLNSSHVSISYAV